MNNPFVNIVNQETPKHQKGKLNNLIPLLILGVSSGIPFGLLASSLILWLKYKNPSQYELAPFFLLTLPYALKFLWAPWTDRIKLPWHKMGQRKSWFLGSQVGTVLGIHLLAAAVNQGYNNKFIFFSAFVSSFFAATHDIVLDGYRIERHRKTPQNLVVAATLSSTGFKIGVYLATAGVLYLVYQGLSWDQSFRWMTLFILFGSLTLLFIKETHEKPSAPHQIFYFKDFFKVPHWILLLLFILTFKSADAICSGFTPAFLVDLSKTLFEIAQSTKFFGYPCMIAGGILGGLLLNQIGLMKGVKIACCIQIAGPLIGYLISQTPLSEQALMYWIGLQNLCCGIGTTAFLSYLSSRCDRDYAASQFSIFYSFSSLSRILWSYLGSLTIEVLGGWGHLFLLTSLMSLCALPVIQKLSTRQREWNDQG